MWLLLWSESFEWGGVMSQQPSKCPKCGEALDHGWQICPACGHAVSSCPSCGQQLKPHWEFCPKCRVRVAGSGSTVSSTPGGAGGGIHVSGKVLGHGQGRSFGSVDELANALSGMGHGSIPARPRADEIPPLPRDVPQKRKSDGIPPLPRDLPPKRGSDGIPPLPPLRPDPGNELFRAIRSRDHARVDALLHGGADVNALGPDGWTPLHVAAQMEDSTMINMLVRHGAVLVLSNGVTPWHIAASEKKNPRLAKLLSEVMDRKGWVHARDIGSRR